MALVLGLIVNAVALWVATLIVPGISLYETAGDAGIDAGAIDNEVSVPTIAALLIVAVVFTLINAVIKPIVQLLSLPLTILTLGLFLLVINALMLMLTSWVTTTFQLFGAEYQVSGFWAAFFGAIVIGLVNWVLGMVIPTRARD
ncbi:MULTISPECIES: phage holin family protein [Dietzia]|uniref:phage holin family protein n=1 Tax=Dietzia TaxID=37914 RepID=UPI0015C8515D|nr:MULTISPECIES: phage holin family protein [Dietzia]MBB1034733.1 phage holin family protein [Dietzia sp. CQ4]MBB1039044.1 phage holin family protein [Dietzia natronolimnaea]MBB1056702.1 phage holin family protein [Dietzia sp. B19]MCT1515003.1 phage holin family protein [Dietzia cercidiphylli]